jgi:hypothetical protein
LVGPLRNILYLVQPQAVVVEADAKSNHKLCLTVILSLFWIQSLSKDLDQGLPLINDNSLSKKASIRIKLWFDYSAQLGFLFERNHLQQNLFGEC